MPTEIWVALIGFSGVCLTTLGTVWIFRKTKQQTDKAQRITETVEADKTGIEGLRELAVQNRMDREEWRKERAQMIAERNTDRARMDRMEQRISELETERAKDRARIQQLEEERHGMARYIQRLREFITSLGNRPPDPEHPLALD